MIDYIVLFCVACAIIISLLLFTRKRVTIYIDLTSVPQDWTPSPFPPQYNEINGLRVGDATYDGFGQKTAVITNVEKIDWTGNRKSVLISVKLSVVLDPRTHQYTYNDIPILIGGTFPLSTSNITFNGQIINIYTSPASRYTDSHPKNAEITVNMRKVEPWQADALTQFVEKDSNGKILARAVSTVITPAELDVATDKGVVYKGYSTIYKNVTITLDLHNVFCANDTCYFNGLIPLKVGGTFWAESDSTVISDGNIVAFTLKN